MKLGDDLRRKIEKQHHSAPIHSAMAPTRPGNEAAPLMSPPDSLPLRGQPGRAENEAAPLLLRSQAGCKEDAVTKPEVVVNSVPIYTVPQTASTAAPGKEAWKSSAEHSVGVQGDGSVSR
jgi:hypothetical protein